MEQSQFTMSILVNNRFGVLSRVTGMYSKRGYNIESIHADPIEGTGRTEIFITSIGDDADKEQIFKQLRKLHDVKEVKVASCCARHKAV